MQQTSALEGILDITLPIAPIDNGLSTLVITLIAITSASSITGLILYWWKRPQQCAQRELTVLLKNHQTEQLDSRQSIFALSQIIRTRIDKNQLAKETSLPAHLNGYQDRWGIFVEELDSARYSHSDLDKINVNKLAKEALFWNRKW